MSPFARVFLLMLLVSWVVSGVALAAGYSDAGLAGFPVALLVGFFYLRKNYPVEEPEAGAEAPWDWRPLMVGLAAYGVVFTLLVALGLPLLYAVIASWVASLWTRQRYQYGEENKTRE